MALFLIYAATEAQKTSVGINACLANGASANAARTAAKAAKPAPYGGEIPDALIDLWTATQLQAADGTLLGSATVNWIQGNVPAGGLGYRGA